MSSVVRSQYNYRVHAIAPEILLLLHTFSTYSPPQWTYHSFFAQLPTKFIKLA